MKHRDTYRSYRSQLLAMLLAAAALAACDNQINVSPTVTAFPDFPSPVDALRTLEISGTLVAEEGSCKKATILFDGLEIQGARTRCEDPNGCAEMALSGVISAFAGHHTITFQVLRQSQDIDTYLALGEVEISRLDLNLPDPVEIELGPTRAPLGPGEGVTFDIDLLDFE